MEERVIGGVVLNYDNYNSRNKYTDGDVEDVLLEAVKKNETERLLKSSKDYAVLYHLSKARENILEWYPFSKDAHLLEIGSGCGALTGLFAQKVKKVTCIELSEKRSEINAFRNKDYKNIEIILGNFNDIPVTNKYDYITLVGVWEYSGMYMSGNNPYNKMLNAVKKLLKKNGKIIIAIENKMGLKYWNGAREDHTSGRFDGLNDYVGEKKVRTFSKQEIINLLNEEGLIYQKFYYPNPDYKFADTIFSNERLPRPGEIRNYKCDYNENRIYNFIDSAVADQICYDNKFDYFANSFLIVCSESSFDIPISYVKYNRFRKPEYQIATIMRNEEKKTVIKRSICKEAETHINNLRTRENQLRKPIVETDFIEGKSLEEFMYSYRFDGGIFIEHAKKYLDKILSVYLKKMQPFKPTKEYIEWFGNNYVERAQCPLINNIDLLFSNVIIDNSGKMTIIDNEWVLDFPVPIEFSIWRAVDKLYSRYIYILKSYYSREEFLSDFSICMENIEIYKKMEKCFYRRILDDYIENYRKTPITLTVNGK